MAERLLLVGMMGAGKTTTARLAAERLGWGWVDTDAEVSRAVGVSVADLFARHGEARFRREESRALADVLERDEPVVVSVGGGAVLDERNRDMLRAAGTVVWLRARPETLIERVIDDVGRPLLVGATPQDRAETLRRIDADRRTLYAEVADDILDVDHLDADQVAERLLQRAGGGVPDRQARA
ncbi:MAG TPA: shikimate kinase [Acidimicrobiales bacterium]|nr:shikimate kinase [Acidimicrobiales bacterium]